MKKTTFGIVFWLLCLPYGFATQVLAQESALKNGSWQVETLRDLSNPPKYLIRNGHIVSNNSHRRMGKQYVIFNVVDPAKPAEARIVNVKDGKELVIEGTGLLDNRSGHASFGTIDGQNFFAFVFGENPAEIYWGYSFTDGEITLENGDAGIHYDLKRVGSVSYNGTYIADGPTRDSLEDLSIDETSISLLYNDDVRAGKKPKTFTDKPFDLYLYGTFTTEDKTDLLMDYNFAYTTGQNVYMPGPIKRLIKLLEENNGTTLSLEEFLETNPYPNSDGKGGTGLTHRQLSIYHFTDDAALAAFKEAVADASLDAPIKVTLDPKTGSVKSFSATPLSSTWFYAAYAFDRHNKSGEESVVLASHNFLFSRPQSFAELAYLNLAARFYQLSCSKNKDSKLAQYVYDENGEQQVDATFTFSGYAVCKAAFDLAANLSADDPWSPIRFALNGKTHMVDGAPQAITSSHADSWVRQWQLPQAAVINGILHEDQEYQVSVNDPKIDKTVEVFMPSDKLKTILEKRRH